MVKFIGSKLKLIPHIAKIVYAVREHGARTAFDPFTGTTRIAQLLKKAGFFTIASDYLTFSFFFAKTFIEADARDYPSELIEDLVKQLNQTPPKDGWFVDKYSRKARFFTEENAMKIQAIREKIESLNIEENHPHLKQILVTALILAADKVDSTVGVQMAYLKQWAPRAKKRLHLEVPLLLEGSGLALRGDAIEIAKNVSVDFAYLDPPYNQHSYLANYHIWETLSLFDNPPTYGKAEKRIDVKARKSPFNSKRSAKAALANLLSVLSAKVILLSFNNEGFLTLHDILNIAREVGFVSYGEVKHKRYIGSQIGIFNKHGERVGKPGKRENKEYLFLIAKDRRTMERLSIYLPSVVESVPLFYT